MSLQLIRRAGLALAAGLLLAGAAQAQSITVKVDGRSPAAVRADIDHAAARVCLAGDNSPLAPVAERGCIEDTVAASLDKVAAARAQSTDLAVAKAPRSNGGYR